MRIALITDTHVAPEAAAFNANWQAAADCVAALGADLTLHLGDITLDGAGHPAHFEHAAALARRWPTPLRFLPGNHDIGDNPPGPDRPTKAPLRPDRLAAYRTLFGPDRWMLEAEGWRLLGLNAQLLGTGSALEAEQWDWLSRHLVGGRGPTVLLLHKPLFQTGPEDAAPHHRYVPQAARRRLLELVARAEVRLVLSGHVHQHLDRDFGGVRHVWLPSTAFILPDALQERLGEKITGLALLSLSAAGGHRLDVLLPDGLARHDILDHPVYPELMAARQALGLEGGR